MRSCFALSLLVGFAASLVLGAVHQGEIIGALVNLGVSFGSVKPISATVVLVVAFGCSVGAVVMIDDDI